MDQQSWLELAILFVRCFITVCFKISYDWLHLRCTSSPTVFSVTPVGTERGGRADHANRSTWSRLTCSKGTWLAAWSTPCRLQADHANVQVTAWRGAAVSIWGMPAGAGCQLLTTVLHTDARYWYSNSVCPSVRPSVCLSVTRWYCMKTA